MKEKNIENMENLFDNYNNNNICISYEKNSSINKEDLEKSEKDNEEIDKKEFIKND